MLLISRITVDQTWICVQQLLNSSLCVSWGHCQLLVKQFQHKFYFSLWSYPASLLPYMRRDGEMIYFSPVVWSGNSSSGSFGPCSECGMQRKCGTMTIYWWPKQNYWSMLYTADCAYSQTQNTSPCGITLQLWFLSTNGLADYIRCHWHANLWWMHF